MEVPLQGMGEVHPHGAGEEGTQGPTGTALSACAILFRGGSEETGRIRSASPVLPAPVPSSVAFFAN